MTNLYEKRNVSDLENRLRLLLCVSELGMVTREQLWPFVAKLNLMEYMPMCLYLDHLLTDGDLAEGQGLLRGVLYLTQVGDMRLKVLESAILASDRQRIAREAPLYMSTLREAMTARAGYELRDGAYGCKCTVTDGDVPSLIVLIRARDKQYVERVVQRFRRNAAAITLRLLALCQDAGSWGADAAFYPGDQPEAALRAAEVGKANLCRLGGGACAAAVCLKNNDTEMRFSLHMPTEASARRWIARMEGGDEAFFQSLRKMMAGIGL